jgi:glyoxylase-like metal-dependent hydrolase (beta-lactamase superfamily II)
MSDLFLKQFLVGPMANFCYLIGSHSKRECLVVDPAWDVKAIADEAAKADMKLVGALVTHYHPDHCGGHLWGHDIEGVAELHGQGIGPIYANKHEIQGLVTVTGLSPSDFRACESGDVIEVGGVKIRTVHTPGHTPGSQCFLVDDALVSGDTLFISGCGRVDLPGGDSDQLYYSLKNQLGRVDPETTLYPGHNYDSQPSMKMREVAKHNPYLRAGSLSEWHAMMGH